MYYAFQKNNNEVDPEWIVKEGEKLLIMFEKQLNLLAL